MPWRTVPTFTAGVLATAAVAVVVWCRGTGRADWPGTDRMVRWCARVWLRAAGAHVVVDGLQHVSPSERYIVVSNHQSNLDPMAHLWALPLSLRVLAKREMFQILLLGPAMRTAGMVEVDRRSPDFRQIDAAAARSLSAGHSLLIYPEGTTSPGETVGEFKDGAFVLAIANQVPVLPVAVHGTCAVWPAGRGWIRPGEVRIAVRAPLRTTGLTGHDVAALREAAREVIRSAHRELAGNGQQEMTSEGSPVMSFTGVDSLDRSIDKTNVWLAAIDAGFASSDRRLAYRVLRAWLHCLRDRLTVEVAAHFAAQLPELLRGVFFDGWNPSRVPRKYGPGEYVTRFATEARVRESDVRKAAGIVTAVARLQMSEGVVTQALERLPSDLRQLLEPAAA